MSKQFYTYLKYLLPALLLAALVWVLLAQTFQPDKERVTEKPLSLKERKLQHFRAALDSLLDAEMDSTFTPGAAVAVVIDTQVILARGFGLKSGTAFGDSVDARTVFRLGSVSKSITALLAAILVQDSVMQWDDKVGSILPAFQLKNKQYSDSLSIRHLLAHTSGLPYHSYTNIIEEGWALSRITPMLRGVDLIAAPGEVYSYQNVAFSLIEEIVDSLHASGFEAQLRERLFEPLGMHNASISYEDITENPNHAKPLYYADSAWHPRRISRTYYNAIPAGGMNASISDMSEFLQAMLGNRPDVIKASSLENFLQANVRVPMRRRYWLNWPGIQKVSYTLGWRLLHFKQDSVLYHGGYVNGYRSKVAVNPKKRWAMAVLSNGPGSFSRRAMKGFYMLYNRFYTLPEFPAQR